MGKDQNQAGEQPEPREGGGRPDLQDPGKREGGDRHWSTPGIAALREEADEGGLDRSGAVGKERRGPVSTAGE